MQVGYAVSVYFFYSRGLNQDFRPAVGQGKKTVVNARVVT